MAGLFGTMRTSICCGTRLTITSPNQNASVGTGTKGENMAQMATVKTGIITRLGLRLSSTPRSKASCSRLSRARSSRANGTAVTLALKLMDIQIPTSGELCGTKG